MKIENTSRLKAAIVQALFFTVFMMLMNILFAYNDHEIEKIFKPKFYIFGVILFFIMAGLYYFTANILTWGRLFKNFKRKK